MNAKDADDSGLPQLAEFRRKAEQRLLARSAKGDFPAAEFDIRALLHELQVHQIELEMQNEELQRVQVAAQEASDMDGYISKPVKGEELVEVVERLSAKAKSERPRDGSSGEAEGITPPVLNTSAFNLDEAMTRLGGEDNLFREMVSFYFSDGLKLLAEIRLAAEKGDARAVEKKAHRLKGTVLYLGARATVEAVARVEVLGRGGDLTDSLDAIRSMETEATRLAEALRPYVPNAS